MNMDMGTDMGMDLWPTLRIRCSSGTKLVAEIAAYTTWKADAQQARCPRYLLNRVCHAILTFARRC